MSTECVHATGTVLYIEDNHVNTMLVERILRARPGVVFTSAPDGRTGLSSAEHLPPDLVRDDQDARVREHLVRLRRHRAVRTFDDHPSPDVRGVRCRDHSLQGGGDEDVDVQSQQVVAGCQGAPPRGSRPR